MTRWPVVMCPCGEQMIRRTQGGDVGYKCETCGRVGPVHKRGVTERDRLIVEMIEKGETRADIAFELGMSEPGVKAAAARVRRSERQAEERRP